VPHVETIALVLFIFAAFLALINLALVSSIKPPLFINEKDSVTSINLKLLKKEAFYPLCLIFLTTFGWYIFIKTFQIFLLKSGLYEPKDVLKFVAFYGLSTVLAQALFVTGIYKKIQYKLSLSISLLGLSLFMALFVIQPGFISVHIQILAIAFFQSMITPNLLGFFSQNHTKDVHGQMMSTHMGVVSSAKIVAPAVSGLIMAKSPSLSILSSSGIMLVCFILLPLIFKKDSKEVKQTP
jgi:predicted MFS family arabinose efflux permease